MECGCECLPDPKFYCAAETEEQAKQKFSEREEIITHLVNAYIYVGGDDYIRTREQARKFIIRGDHYFRSHFDLKQINYL